MTTKHELFIPENKLPVVRQNLSTGRQVISTITTTTTITTTNNHNHHNNHNNHNNHNLPITFLYSLFIGHTRQSTAAQFHQPDEFRPVSVCVFAFGAAGQT
jgi:hypothetical protein